MTLLLPLLLLAAPVAPDPQSDGPPIIVKGPEPAQPQTPATMVVEPVAMMIATFDADGNALVDRSEMQAGVRASFETAEKMAGVAATSGKLRYIAFADWALTFLGDRNALPSPFEVDRDSDGQITLEELQDQFSRLFARYDKDGSKTISRAELLTFRTAPIDARGPTMGRRPPPGAQDGEKGGRKGRRGRERPAPAPDTPASPDGDDRDAR
ncbi:EF-hand domain-containing protein [Sphingomonas sp.]|jgi:hypothetical protein|uniref:EF-hand domain-containing protein n=1 Tax=Sphingomonas sp. TaxID=28214 RepID=UPI0035C7F736